MDGDTRPVSRLPPSLNVLADVLKFRAPGRCSGFHQNGSEIVLAASHSYLGLCAQTVRSR
jgi:hypothetical protein